MGYITVESGAISCVKTTSDNTITITSNSNNTTLTAKI
jgi:hypothetical protein